MPIILMLNAVIFGVASAAAVMALGGTIMSAFLAYAAGGAVGLMAAAVALYARSKVRGEGRASLLGSGPTRAAPQQATASGAS